VVFQTLEKTRVFFPGIGKYPIKINKSLYVTFFREKGQKTPPRGLFIEEIGQFC